MVEFDAEVMKVKICAKCKGLGGAMDNAGHHFKCDCCGGTGRVVQKTLKNLLGIDELDVTVPYDPEEMKIKICRSCKGLGKSRWGSEQMDCPECGGTGRFVEHKIVTEYRLNEVDGLQVED